MSSFQVFFFFLVWWWVLVFVFCFFFSPHYSAVITLGGRRQYNRVDTIVGDTKLQHLLFKPQH